MYKELDQGTFEAIEAYLTDALSPQERERFETRVSTDETLRREVEVQRENMIAVQLGAFSREVWNIIGDGRSDTVQEDRVPRTPFFRSTGARIAAVLILVIGVAGAWLLTPNKYERALAEHYVPDPGLPVPMSADNDAAFHDAMVDFKVGAFEKAASKWSALLVKDPTNDTLRYYLGNAQVSSGRAEEAIPLYTGIVNEPGSAFRYKAEWRLFLVYVSLEQDEQIRTFTVTEGSPYTDRINEVRKELLE